MTLHFLILILILLALSAGLKAQYGSFGLTDARQLGLGNTYVTNSRDLYAAGKNPSLLAYRPNDRKLSILFPNLSARAYNISKVSGFINDYFSQEPIDIITGLDGSVLKNAFANEGKLYMSLQIGYLGVGYTPGERIGSFSFAMKDHIGGFLQLPKSIVAFNNNYGKHEVSGFYFRDFVFSASWTRSYELSYGRIFHTDPSTGILAIYGGIGLKYISGFIYNDISFSAGAGYEDENGILTGTYTASAVSAYSDDVHLDKSYDGEEVISNVPFMDPVGSGFGVDLGLTLLLDPGVKVGLSVTDAGFINWKGKTKQTIVSGVIKLDSTLTIEDIDSLAKLVIIERETHDHFRTNPPSALHMGVAFMVERFIQDFPGEMNVAIELHQGLATSVENPDQTRVALGVDWKPGKFWPILLTGISTSQQKDFTWSLGLGYELKFLEIYIASPNVVPTIDGNDLQSLSLSICWHFVKNKKAKPDT